MGIGTVFFGLICIIILSSLMSAVCARLGKKEPAAPAVPAVPAAPASSTIPNRQALIAAISAAVAEDMGTSPAGIRILSVKQL